MFSYLRYFFAASLVLIVGATLFLGWYFRTAADEVLIKQSEDINISLAQSYINNVWADYRENVNIIYNEIAPEERKNYKEFEDFGIATTIFLQEIPVIKFNIYSPNGTLFLATDPSTINISSSYDPTPVRADMDDKDNAHNYLDPLNIMSIGEARSEIIFDAVFTDVRKEARRGILVRTLVPIVVDDTIALLGEKVTSEGVLEIYYEVTEASNILRNFQYIGMGFVICIFFILYTALIFTTRRAEGIIEKQYDANAELTSAKSKAELENKQKSEFLAAISHELRTPLNAIIGFSEIIKDEVMGALNNDTYKTYISDIHSQGVHLSVLINDILDYSKAEAGKLDMVFDEIDLNKLITSCLRTQEPRAQEGDVNLVKELPSEHIVMTTDAKRLKQTLLNLLSNSVKFTPEGGDVTISAWENVTDKRIGIEVKDTGIGISAKDLAKALSPFGQVDSTLSRRYEGTGLGLPLTQSFVELLGGEMKIDSVVGKGTTITIFLPRGPHEEMKPSTGSIDERAPAQQERVKPKATPIPIPEATQESEIRIDPLMDRDPLLGGEIRIDPIPEPEPIEPIEPPIQAAPPKPVEALPSANAPTTPTMPVEERTLSAMPPQETALPTAPEPSVPAEPPAPLGITEPAQPSAPQNPQPIEPTVPMTENLTSPQTPVQPANPAVPENNSGDEAQKPLFGVPKDDKSE